MKITHTLHINTTLNMIFKMSSANHISLATKWVSCTIGKKNTKKAKQYTQFPSNLQSMQMHGGQIWVKIS